MHRYTKIVLLGCLLAVTSRIAVIAVELQPGASSEAAVRTAATAPAAETQRIGKAYRIGFVSPAAQGPRDAAFSKGLRDLGYVDGNNLRLEVRFAEGRPERIPALIDELIRLKVDVLVVGATVGARAAKNATTSIPIVFAGSSDPVAGGVVRNLARPEGNLTGTSLAFGEKFAGKWLEALKETVPHIAHFAVLWSSSNPAATRFVEELRNAARTLKVTIDVHHAAEPAQLDQALAAIASTSAGGLVVTPSPFAAANQEKLIAFAATHRLPAIYFVEDFVLGGGLMSYGPSIVEAYGRAAGYVDKILRNGAKPGDLAVAQPERFELVVNTATARQLGLAIPQSILLRARVVE